MARRKRDDARQVRFAHEFVFGEHADHITDAAMAAGYTRQYARTAGRILALPRVREMVDQLQAQREDALKRKYLRVAEETYRQAVSDVGDLFKDGKLLSTEEMPSDARKAIAGIEVERRTEGRGEDAEVYYLHKIKLVDKRASQELFLKYAGKLKSEPEETAMTIAQLVLAADQKLREMQAKKP